MTATRILFIGNSFTGRNDVPGMVRQLAASADPPTTVETEASLLNGMALKTHWDRGDALKLLEGSQWEYVSLQEQSTLPFKNPARMRDYVLKFDKAIRGRGAKTVLYLTWARQDAPERQAEITDAYVSAGREAGALVVPAGIAWERVLGEYPDLVLHDADKSHPSLAGSYLAACCFHATLFGASPEGLWNPAKLNVGDAERLQQAAWETVTKFKDGG